MSASGPEQICRLFQQHMATGDLEATLTLYDPDAAFLNRAGREGLDSMYHDSMYHALSLPPKGRDEVDGSRSQQVRKISRVPKQ